MSNLGGSGNVGGGSASGAAFSAIKSITFAGGGGPATITKSSGISSLTDHGTGAFTANFTEAFPDVNYQFMGTIYVGSNTTHGHITQAATGGATVSSCRFYQGTGTTTLSDGITTRMIFVDS